MKKSINAWSIDKQTGFEQMFQAVKDAGFDGIELNVDSTGHSAHSLTMETTERELADIRRLSERYSLPIASISTSLSGGKMGTGDPEDRAFAKALIRKQILCAKALGANGILTAPGGISETVSMQAAWDNALITLRELCAEVAEGGIYVGVENVWNGFFASPFDMARFVDALDCPFMSAYYDVGNVIAFSWSEYWVEILGSRISHVHVKDFKRSRTIHSGGTFVGLLQGDLAWAKVITALRATGFDGYLTAEVSRGNPDQPYPTFYREVSSALDIITNL